MKRFSIFATITVLIFMGTLILTKPQNPQAQIGGGYDTPNIPGGSGKIPVTEIMLDRIGGAPTEVFSKFSTGWTADNDVPDIVDFSYAGYKNGNEAIPYRTGPIIDVTRYGAIPNDDRSDYEGVRAAFAAASEGCVIYFPPGQYDFLTDADYEAGREEKIDLPRRNNFTVRGAGAQGSDRGGTTLMLHRATQAKWHGFFRYSGNDWHGKVQIANETPRGSMYIDVENASSFVGKDFILISAENLPNDPHWGHHCSRGRGQMDGGWTDIRDGLDIEEYNEIDRIELDIDGNGADRIHLKTPTLSFFNSDYTVEPRGMGTGVGVEDIHFKSNLREFDHNNNDQPTRSWGRGALSIDGAHNWVRHCTFENVTEGVWMRGYCNTVVGVIMWGRGGHYSVTGVGTRNLYAFIEDWAGVYHGVGLGARAAGNVFLGCGGKEMRGPDNHSSQGRHTLIDNYISQNIEENGGASNHKPHHLDGYVRWNGVVTQENRFNFWDQPWAGGEHLVTQAIVVGLQTTHTNANNDYPVLGDPYLHTRKVHQIENAYSEKTDRLGGPLSLYIGQYSLRVTGKVFFGGLVGTPPAWYLDEKQDYEDWFRHVWSDLEGPNIAPLLSPKGENGEPISVTISEDHGAARIGPDFSAVDADSDSLTFHLGGGHGNYFHIHPKKGVVFKKSTTTFSHSVISQYSVTVSVTDGVLWDSVDMNIKIRKPPPPVPDVQFQDDDASTRHINENSPVGTPIGDPVTATVNEGEGALWYKIRSNDARVFDIDRSTGQLKVKAPLDYETQNRYEVLVGVYRGTSAIAIDLVFIIVHVIDVTILEGRTQEVIDAIVASLPDRETKFDVLESDLKTITSLNISNKDFTALTSNDFNGLSKLRSLTISNNDNLTRLPVGIFSDLKSLKSLILRDNAIQVIYANGFSGLKNLEILWMEFNKISSLPHDIFYDLSNLNNLSINNNRLTSISPRQFSENDKLTFLDLRFNRIRSIYGKAFSENDKLENLLLSHNQLRRVNDGIFKGLKNLESLHLQGNPVNPIKLLVQLESEKRGEVKAVMLTGAPFDVVLPIIISGGSGDDTLEIDAGETESNSIRVTRTAGEVGPVTVNIGTVPTKPTFLGCVLSKSADLPITVIDEGGSPQVALMPTNTLLLNNFPNPFNPETWIPYQLAQKSFVNIKIYNASGVVVRRLSLGIQPAGYYKTQSRAAHWDGKNSIGEPVSTGIYFYQLNAGSLSVLKKMVILK